MLSLLSTYYLFIKRSTKFLAILLFVKIIFFLVSVGLVANRQYFIVPTDLAPNFYSVLSSLRPLGILKKNSLTKFLTEPVY